MSILLSRCRKLLSPDESSAKLCKNDVKRQARALLAESPSQLTYMQALEVVAKRLGFESYYHLNNSKTLAVEQDRMERLQSPCEHAVVPLSLRDNSRAAMLQSDQKRWDNSLAAAKIALKQEDVIYLGNVIDERITSFNTAVALLSDCPHLLVLGKTGSGKTTTMQSLVLSLANLYADSEWIFVDGKSGSEWNIFATHLSSTPVFKEGDEAPDRSKVFALAIGKIYAEFRRRQTLYVEVKASDLKSYRVNAAKELPRLFVVIDEVMPFLVDIDFPANASIPETSAYMLRALLAQARSYGIHIIVSTQRMNADMPSVMRGNLTTQLFHSSAKKDAIAMDIPVDRKLRAGEYFLRGSGCEDARSEPSAFLCRMPRLNTEQVLKGLKRRKQD